MKVVEFSHEFSFRFVEHFNIFTLCKDELHLNLHNYYNFLVYQKYRRVYVRNIEIIFVFTITISILIAVPKPKAWHFSTVSGFLHCSQWVVKYSLYLTTVYIVLKTNSCVKTNSLFCDFFAECFLDISICTSLKYNIHRWQKQFLHHYFGHTYSENVSNCT